MNEKTKNPALIAENQGKERIFGLQLILKKG